MKKTTILILSVCAVLIAAVLINCRIQSVDSLQKNQNISGVAFGYNDIEASPHGGACPQIEAGQPEMENFQDFLLTMSVRRDWLNPKGGGMDVPGYDLCFFDENAKPVVEMYISRTGYLRCGKWVYRITAPDAEEVWEQLGSLYESAVSLQN